MRLVCPNCGAQYEVDDAVIPPNGRDVQCSNCAHGWFQPSKAMLDAEAATPEPDPAPEDWDAKEWESAADAPVADVGAEAPETATVEADSTEDAPSVEDAFEDSEEEIDWDFDAEEGEDTADPESEEIAPLSEVAAQADMEAHSAAVEAEPNKALQDTSPADDDTRDKDDTDVAIASLLAVGTAEDAIGAAPKAGATPRKPLDDSLLSVLREEAEREAAHRRAEGVSELQVQDEMALDGAPEATEAPIAPAARLAEQRRSVPDFSDLNDPDAEDEDRVADLNGSEPDDPQRTRGRERLPNIDEINDTLTATTDRTGESIAESSPEMAARRRSGFSRGFVVVLLLAAVFALTYIFAPRISARFPAAAAPMARYVATVDQGRVWLNDQMSAMTDKLQGDQTDAH
ncbi:zinc-ribbon domain-containing protein [Thioclava sp.]|uniref:zinc-ribbon domain-containing protein n=1 Tax=Thioclava sp. TaxID=1933450 RepID=UPI003AA8FC15